MTIPIHCTAMTPTDGAPSTGTSARGSAACEGIREVVVVVVVVGVDPWCCNAIPTHSSLTAPWGVHSDTSPTTRYHWLSGGGIVV